MSVNNVLESKYYLTELVSKDGTYLCDTLMPVSKGHRLLMGTRPIDDNDLCFLIGSFKGLLIILYQHL